MRLAVVQIVPLIGEDDAVLLALLELLGQSSADVLVVVRIAERHRRHLHELGPAQPQHVLLFLALRLRNDDEGAVAARIGDQREPDAGIASGRFHHQSAGAQLAALLGFQDHLPAGAILHRAARVHELGLAENGAAGRRGGAFQLDQWRMADGLNDAVADLHARFRVAVGTKATLVDTSWGDKAGLDRPRRPIRPGRRA